MADRASGTSTREYSRFQSNIAMLSRAIAPDLHEFAIKTLGRALITTPNFSDAVNTNINAEERSSNLLVILLNRIGDNSADYYEVFEILKSIPTLKEVVKNLHIQDSSTSVSTSDAGAQTPVQASSTPLNADPSTEKKDSSTNVSASDASVLTSTTPPQASNTPLNAGPSTSSTGCYIASQVIAIFGGDREKQASSIHPPPTSANTPVTSCQSPSTSIASSATQFEASGLDSATTTVSSRLGGSGLEEEIARLEKDFEDLVHSTEESFIENRVRLIKIQKSIQHLPVSLKLELGDYFREADVRKVLNTQSMQELFFVLSPYWNYLNPGLLEFLVGRFGSQGDIVLLRMYLEKLNRFRASVKVVDFVQITEGRTVNYQKFSAIMGDDWKEKTLQDVEEYKTVLSKELHLQSFLVHTGIEPS